MQWLKSARIFWLTALTTALALLCVVPAPTFAQDGAVAESVPVVDLPTAPAIQWMETLYRRIQEEGVSAPGASRIYGYAGVTMYESLLGGMPNNITLAGQIYHLPDL